MASVRQPPRARPRLSDAETERRVVDAALQLLAEQGITVGLDGLRFEDVVRAADVSRTSAYRRWPSRDAFVADVLVALARGTELTGIGDRIGDEVGALLAADTVDLTDPQGRHDLFVQLLRLSFQTDVEGTLASPEFHTYLALRAAFVGVPDDDLRDEIAAALAHSERRAVARGRVVVAGAARLLGMRLVPPLAGDDGYTLVARAVSAASTGFAVSALADPGLVRATRPLAPFGSTRTAPWSVPALTLAGIVLTHLEPDPDAPVPTLDDLTTGLRALIDAGAQAAATAE